MWSRSAHVWSNVAKLARRRPRLAKMRPKTVEAWPVLDQTCLSSARTRPNVANLGPNSVELGPMLAETGPDVPNSGSNMAGFGPYLVEAGQRLAKSKTSLAAPQPTGNAPQPQHAPHRAPRRIVAKTNVDIRSLKLDMYETTSRTRATSNAGQTGGAAPSGTSFAKARSKFMEPLWGRRSKVEHGHACVENGLPSNGPMPN